jgi:hypothetical protein
VVTYKPYNVTNADWLKPIFRFRIAIVMGNWLNQGFLYSDRTEKAFRIALDLAFAIPLYLLLSNFIASGWSFSLALVTAHTFNWAFNGQFFAMYRFVNTDPAAFEKNTFEKNLEYLKEVKSRIEVEKSILCADLSGSMVREKFNKRSDVDVRIVRKEGFINGVRACLFGFLERSRALLQRIPLDLYVSDSMDHLSKRKADEVPVVLHDPEGLLKERYSKVVNFDGDYQ